MTSQTASSSRKSHRGLFIGLILLIVLGAGAGAAVYLQKAHKKTSSQTKANQDLAKQNAQNNSADTGTSASSLPAGYQKVSRDCFSLGLPNQDITLATDNSCFLQASYTTSDGRGSFNIFPETNSYADLNAFVAAKKQQYTSVVLSEKDVTINGLTAHTVIENSGSASAPQSLARTYVLVAGKNYTYQSVPVTGFEINGSYNSTSWQFIYNTALSTWQWK